MVMRAIGTDVFIERVIEVLCAAFRGGMVQKAAKTSLAGKKALRCSCSGAICVERFEASAETPSNVRGV
ncbi:MAG: hypothetical protein ACKO2L_08205, partial [Planctomycetaceae bacterium]